jgi:hypothetical protein
VSVESDRARIARNNRITATILWGIVALFFFGIVVKYLFLAR